MADDDNPHLGESTLHAHLLPVERAHIHDQFLIVKRVAARQRIVLDSGHLGSYWRWLRAERSLQQVADLDPELSKSYLSKLESEASPNPSLRVLLALQRVYGTPGLDHLVDARTQTRALGHDS